MIQRIPLDFDVKLLNKVENLHLFHGLRTLHHHLVCYINADVNTVLQKHISRYELALCMLNSQPNSLPQSLLCGDLLHFDHSNPLALIYYVQIEPHTHLPILIDNEPWLSQLKTDLELLKTIRNTSPKELDIFLQDWAKSLSIEHFDASLLDEKDKEHLLFEQTVLRKSEIKKQVFGVSDIYPFVFQNEIEEGFIESFEGMLQHTVFQESCDCGSPDCFFDELKANQRTFFPHLTPTDNFDFKHEFETLWNALKPKQKGALLYLFVELGNTPFFNLGLFREDFELSRYQELLCSPYQPDSDDEQALRMLTGNVWEVLREN